MVYNKMLFVPGKSAIRNIETFAETICDSLFINDTYYGNILMCLTELNDIFIKDNIQDNIEIFYETDFKILTLFVYIYGQNIYSRHETDKHLRNSNKKFNLVQTLSDSMEFSEKGLIFTFNISALHNSIYEDRLKHINKYFKKLIKVKN